jgi:hypothetical protein
LALLAGIVGRRSKPYLPSPKKEAQQPSSITREDTQDRRLYSYFWPAEETVAAANKLYDGLNIPAGKPSYGPNIRGERRE